MRYLPWVVCGVLALLAFLLKFCLPGYGFAALLCCFAIAVILFYTVTGGMMVRFPAVCGWLRRVFTVCLCMGLAVVLVTEAFVIRASFGDKVEDVDYVVVLGAKVWQDGPSPTLWRRIYAAKEHLEEHPEDIVVVSGGQGQDESMTEARAMYEELVKLGIDPGRILLEEKATSTWENLNFSLDIIEEAFGVRPGKIGVISSDYHLFRASLFAKECGVEFAGIPADSTWGQKLNHFPREVAGVWHFIILGGTYD